MSRRRRTVAVATVVAAAALILGVPAASDAGESRYAIKIAFADGRVSLVAEEAPASEVLAEWSRYGKTEVLGAELLERKLVTVMLEEVSEGEALDAILGRGVAYLTVPRRPEPGRVGLRASPDRRRRDRDREAGRSVDSSRGAIRVPRAGQGAVGGGLRHTGVRNAEGTAAGAGDEVRLLRAGESHRGLWPAGVRADATSGG